MSIPKIKKRREDNSHRWLLFTEKASLEEDEERKKLEKLRQDFIEAIYERGIFAGRAPYSCRHESLQQSRPDDDGSNNPPPPFVY